MKFLVKRLLNKDIWKKIYLQRLTEPLHLNFISLFVFLFGSLKRKIDYDLIIRPHHAYGIMQAALNAQKQGLQSITILEFGVANGAGLMNMIAIAKRVEKETKIKINIYGFDTGKGMPKPIDYKDHPEIYNEGDYPMNKEALEQAVKNNAQIFYGEIKDTLNEFKTVLDETSPIGFISIDVDYYSSTMDVFKILAIEPTLFLPLTYLFFDDIALPHHNSKCGELLAIDEFNKTQALRQIEHHTFFENTRIFKNQDWIKQLYFYHVLDHPKRYDINQSGKPNVLDNPYLSFEGNKRTFNR